MAVSVNRCCGGASIGSTCRPSARSSASSAASRWIGTLVAASVLVLATHVATAGAEDAPQPPAMPAMPTIAVQVDVSIPGISVNVQTGAVDVSVSTESVEVSVSVSSAGTSPSIDVAGSKPQQTTPSDASTGCCTGGERDVDAADTSETKAPAPRAAAPERPRPVHTAAASAVHVQTRATRHVAHPKLMVARAEIPRPAIAQRKKETRAAVVKLSDVIRQLPRPTTPRSALAAGSPVRAAALPVEHMRDNRLLLQLGLLVALLYLVCLAGWFSSTTRRRRRA